ncbi:MAG: hypothetical protein IKA10_06850 [Oscillospiraceae bacterium]|nr:hypothetical protein [Oscillospiraceae bacterium]
MEHNFYTLMLVFLGVIFLVFVIMVLSMTLINYFGAMYYIKTEQKKREKLGIDYFFQDEDGNELPQPIKNEDFQPMSDDLFDKVIEDKKEKQRNSRRASWEERNNKYVVTNEELVNKEGSSIPDSEFAEINDDLFSRIENSKKK